MKRVLTAILLSFAALPLVLSDQSALAQQSAEQSQSRTVQGQVRKEMRAGKVRSLREIEQRVLPTMPGMEYLGPEYDPAMMVYRLKFIRSGRVVFVDVDAKSGTIISQSR